LWWFKVSEIFCLGFSLKILQTLSKSSMYVVWAVFNQCLFDEIYFVNKQSLLLSLVGV
jgi:hypothetical protein